MNGRKRADRSWVRAWLYGGGGCADEQEMRQASFVCCLQQTANKANTANSLSQIEYRHGGAAEAPKDGAGSERS